MDISNLHCSNLPQNKLIRNFVHYDTSRKCIHNADNVLHTVSGRSKRNQFNLFSYWINLFSVEVTLAYTCINLLYPQFCRGFNP